MRIDLSSPIDLPGFRAQANSMLAHQVPPADISWQALASQASGEVLRGTPLRAPSLGSALHSVVPRSFVRLTELVVLHRDEDRFDLLYRLVGGLVHYRAPGGRPRHGDVMLARSMAYAVRRDVARTRRALRLRPLAAREGVVLRLAWCVPQHHVAEALAQWLARTETAAPWLLATPERCALWTGDRLLCGPGLPTVVAARADDANWYRIATQLAGGALAPPAP
jgi:hypothetical protein